MSSTAVAQQESKMKNVSVREAKFVDKFNDIAKLETNSAGSIYVDKGVVEKMKRFQKTTLKNTIGVIPSITILTGGITFINNSLADSSQSVFVLLSALGISFGTSFSFVFGLLNPLAKRSRQRNNLISKNSLQLVKEFLTIRGVTVEQETLEDIATYLVNCFTANALLGTVVYNTVDGKNFTFKTSVSGDVVIEFAEVAQPQNAIVSSQTEFLLDTTTVSEIKNKIVLLSTQKLAPETTYSVNKAHIKTTEAVELAQQLKALGDDSWGQALDDSLTTINNDLDVIIEDCRVQTRQQLESIRVAA